VNTPPFFGKDVESILVGGYSNFEVSVVSVQLRRSSVLKGKG